MNREARLYSSGRSVRYGIGQALPIRLAADVQVYRSGTLPGVNALLFCGYLPGEALLKLDEIAYLFGGKCAG